MFENSRTIIRIDGKNCFLDLCDAFNLDGKVCFQFRQYNSRLEKGKRITKSIDCYMKLEDFSYFCQIMKTGRIERLAQQAKANSESGFIAPLYVNYGGTNKQGQPVVSKKLQIEAGTKSPLVLCALQGPGVVGKTGMITPNYLDKDKSIDKIYIPLSEESMIKIGIAGTRAIYYYDTWSANGTLDDKLEALKKIGQPGGQSHKDSVNKIQFPEEHEPPYSASVDTPVELRY